jgi:hypothetical protein
MPQLPIRQKQAGRGRGEYLKSQTAPGPLETCISELRWSLGSRNIFFRLCFRLAVGDFQKQRGWILNLECQVAKILHSEFLVAAARADKLYVGGRHPLVDRMCLRAYRARKLYRQGSNFQISHSFLHCTVAQSSSVVIIQNVLQRAPTGSIYSR